MTILITDRKAYKQFATHTSSMFPGDPTGLPDDFFYFLWGYF